MSAPAVTLPRARRATERSTKQATKARDAARRRGGINAAETPEGRAAIAELRRVLPAWAGQGHWLDVTGHFLRSPVGRKLCRRNHIAAETALAAAYNLSRLADGTGLAISESKVAAAGHLNRDPEQIKRAMRVLRRAGLVVEIYGGRELNFTERVAADRKANGRHGHGKPFTGQRGYTNIYVLGFFDARRRSRISTGKPGRFARIISLVPLPPEGWRTAQTSRQIELSLAAAGAARTKAPPPAALRRPRGRPAAAFAAQVFADHRLDPLFFGVPIGTVVAQLTPYQRGGWSARDLAGMLHAEAVRRHVDVGRRAWRPHALLKALLSTVSLVDDGPAVLGRPRPAECAACVGGWRKDADGGWWECDHSPGLVDEAARF